MQILFAFGKWVWAIIVRSFSGSLTKTTVRVMQLTAIFILAVCLQVSASGFSQSLTLKFSDAPLQTVLKQIEKKTNYSFIYGKGLLEKSKPVNIDVVAMSLEKILELVFNNQPLEHKISGEHVIISFKVTRDLNREPEVGLSPQLTPPIIGVIRDSHGNPIAGVNVVIKGTNRGITTDAQGKFSIDANENDVLVISSIGYNVKEVKITSINVPNIIALERSVSQLDTTEVVVSTGYQNIPKERATGSFSFLENSLINRSVTTNILDRIENVATGVLFDRSNNAPDPLLIRGRNSIYSNVSPLIVLDNFPYDGDINNINPNDVESITILKDAAAASIWGARAGNGVIVITTKRGKSVKPQIQLNLNMTIQDRPDLFSLPIISGADAIEVEKYLFEKGYYDAAIANTTNRPPLTPVQELLIKKKEGVIPEAEFNHQMNAYKAIDTRSDLERYFYQVGVNSQNSLNVSGNSNKVNYYMSVGWDKNTSNLVSNIYDRITLRSQNTFKVTNSLQISAGVSYFQTNTVRGNNPGTGINSGAGKGLYPYADLVGSNGNSLTLERNFRNEYIDTVGGGKLLDWKYSPYSDINEREHMIYNKEYLITTGLKYDVLSYLSIELKYQFTSNTQISKDHQFEKSYYARDLINRYSQISTEGEVIRPIPIGGIMDIINSDGRSNQGRAQLNFNKNFLSNHSVAAIAGWEIKDLVTMGNSQRIYGYRPDKNIVADKINYDVYYPIYSDPSRTGQIPQLLSILKTTDRFISYYANTSYTLDEKYTFTASAREDAANLFGVKTNQRGTPLWSFGGSWLISKEKFYTIRWLNSLRFRVTYGVNGNISRKTSAYTTATFGTALSVPNLVTASIVNPPNEQLRWEQVKTFNAGVDFQIKNNRLSGSFEFYSKGATDLMGQAPIDPTYGFGSTGGQSFFYGNVANMKGNGVDIELRSKNITGAFSWNTNVGFSRAYMEISKYLMPQNTNSSSYLGAGAVNPVVGKPVFAVYAYSWNGLDPNTGDPLGKLNGHTSTDYNAISRLPLDSLQYKGPIQPVHFGFLRNDFYWKNFSLSFNISYKGGYMFRRPSIIYGALFSSWTGHSDYAKRWEKTGDEAVTNIPSLVYDPAGSGQRDAFYANSEILVEKGDHIRLEDVQLSYLFQPRKMFFQQLKIYSYIKNIGMIWKSNAVGTDPYFQEVPTPSAMVSFGVSATF